MSSTSLCVSVSLFVFLDPSVSIFFLSPPPHCTRHGAGSRPLAQGLELRLQEGGLALGTEFSLEPGPVARSWVGSRVLASVSTVWGQPWGPGQFRESLRPGFRRPGFQSQLCHIPAHDLEHLVLVSVKWDHDSPVSQRDAWLPGAPCVPKQGKHLINCYSVFFLAGGRSETQNPFTNSLLLSTYYVPSALIGIHYPTGWQTMPLWPNLTHSLFCK